MPTPSEGRALLFVAAVAALGLGVRGWRAARGPEPHGDDREALARQIAMVDSVVASGGRRRVTRATSTTGTPPPRTPAAQAAGSAAPIDLDRAGVEELESLPGIGPALAARILADRAQHGPFGSIDALQQVKGIGPTLAARLAPRVTFSAPPRPPPPKSPARGARRP